MKRKNVKSLQSLGGMSAEIQESLANFKVIVAFNRRDYFRAKFDAANEQNFTASVGVRDGEQRLHADCMGCRSISRSSSCWPTASI